MNKLIKKEEIMKHEIKLDNYTSYVNVRFEDGMTHFTINGASNDKFTVYYTMTVEEAKKELKDRGFEVNE
ncbi:UNVERIFIED_CONTAM: hypothetical protein RF648_20750 [Kocuria sp. CPCC 205274]|uniref:Phage protein n=1 Tax=Herbiconiux daphne TaxID=2970914 RepID=A0ABT2H9D7_9MICO|nr:hypothetical protein [Herbiconiux daphne]MCS5736511.1 hypothetical protein [Herbiconiux daphne]